MRPTISTRAEKTKASEAFAESIKAQAIEPELHRALLGEEDGDAREGNLAGARQPLDPADDEGRLLGLVGEDGADDALALLSRHAQRRSLNMGTMGTMGNMGNMGKMGRMGMGRAHSCPSACPALPALTIRFRPLER